MAPKRGSKRTAGSEETAEAAAAPAAKRGKAEMLAEEPVDPIAEQCEEVLAALCGKDSPLPEEVRAMFTATIPFCLQVPLSERHNTQAAVVTMITDALAKIEAGLQGTADEAEEASRIKCEEKDSRAAEAKKAEAAFTQKLSVIEAKEASVQENIAAVKTAQEKLGEAEESEAKLSEERSLITANKEAYEAVVKEHLAPLRDGTAETTPAPADGEAATSSGAEEETKKHVAVLLPLCKKVGMEESLMQALPCVVAKPLAERSSFDGLTFTEVENKFLHECGVLGQKLAAGATAAAEQRAAVAAARGAFDVAEATRKASIEDLEAEKTEQEALGRGWTEAQKTERALAPAIRKADADRAKTLKRLAELREGPLAALQKLRDGPEEAEPVADVTMAEPEKIEEAPAPMVAAC